MTDDARCRCCGIPVDETRATMRRCPVCDRCDGLHGDALQIRVVQLMTSGRMPWGHALARMMIDDAQIAGRLVYVPCDHPGRHGHHIAIPNPPKRWEVVVARAICRDEFPDITLMISVILARFIPGRCNRATLDAIAAEIGEAVRMIDPNVLTVTVDSKRDVLDPSHLIITVQSTTPTIGAVVDVTPGVKIPADIYQRPRGQA